MNTETSTVAWPRTAYWALWTIALTSVLAGIILFVIGQVDGWVPTTGDPNVYQLTAVSLVPLASVLCGAGSVAVIVTLMLEAFVGPLHRRRPRS